MPRKKHAEQIDSTAATVGLNLASSSLSTLSTTTLQSMDFDKIGTGDFFNSDMFMSQMGSKGTWASLVAGAASAGVSAYGSGVFGAMGAEANKFYGGAMSLATSAASTAASYGVHVAFNGGDWAGAYETMGGISVNVASFGALADFVGSGIARNNATGQSILGKVMDKLDGRGIMLNIGLDGVSASVGSGGIDLSGNLYDLGKRALDKRALESYTAAHGQEKGAAAWNNYVYGDWTQENTSARLASGLDQLELVDQANQAGFTARTTSNGVGGRLIQLVDSGNSYNNAIALGHESHRDGIIGTASQQAAETLAATTAHTQMALRMFADGKEGQIQMTENLAMDITAYKLSQYLGDNSIFAGYVAGNYDASADYWKLISRSDGSHVLEAEYDKNGKLITDLTIAYYAEGQNGEWELVGEDFHENLTGSAAGSIVQFLGRERAAELLGSHLGNADLYDKQTLMDVLDITDMEASKIQRSGKLPDDVTELQLTKLAGEALLKKNGFSYTPETSWKGGTMDGLQLVDNNTMGYISFGKGDSSYDHERFVVTASLVRDTRSLSGYTYGESDYQTNVFNTNSEPYETKSQSLQSQYRELDQIIYRKYGLNNEMLDTYTPGNVQSVDVYNVVERIMEEYRDENGEIQKKVKAEINRDQPYYLHGFGWTQGNTVMSDYSLRILSLDNSVENIMEIHNAWTMDGDWINKAALDNDPGGRWLVHSSKNLTSDGCFIYQEHTLDDLQNKLREWGLHSGHHISGTLKWF